MNSNTLKLKIGTFFGSPCRVNSLGVLCVTQANADDSDVMANHEDGDVLTLIHHELNICTNSVNFSFLFSFILVIRIRIRM